MPKPTIRELLEAMLPGVEEIFDGTCEGRFAAQANEELGKLGVPLRFDPGEVYGDAWRIVDEKDARPFDTD